MSCADSIAKMLTDAHFTSCFTKVLPSALDCEEPIVVTEGAFSRQVLTVAKSSLGELTAALEWLADYPHGCLEQTSSRIFPLVTAGGILNAVGSRAATNREEYVAAGVRRVESMIRAKDFVMWPDCNYAPWDREVSLYASPRPRSLARSSTRKPRSRS